MRTMNATSSMQRKHLVANGVPGQLLVERQTGLHPNLASVRLRNERRLGGLSKVLVMEDAHATCRCRIVDCPSVPGLR